MLFGRGLQLCYKGIRMAQIQKLLTEMVISAVVKVDAEHTDQPTILLDKHGAGTQLFSVDGNAVVMQAVILGFIAAIH